MSSLQNGDYGTTESNQNNLKVKQTWQYYFRPGQVKKSPIFSWVCGECGEDKLTPGSYVMRIVLKVEADINQADTLHKLEVSFLHSSLAMVMN